MDPERWQQISRIFQAGLACDRQERARLLEKECAGDDALRRDVESLLELQDDPDHFLSEPAVALVARTPVDASDPSLLGRQFGPYAIVAQLGAGGMGVVYRARDAKLERDIALKVLPRGLADDPEHRARLLREARAVAALNHPNICTVHEVAEAEGRAYIAMELVEGQSLSARLAEGPLPTEEVLRYGLQLADGLAHAHDRGVVHRDLKSANVMVTPEGRVKTPFMQKPL